MGFIASTCFSVCFFKAFSKEEYVNLACSIICLRLEGNISPSVRYSYLSVLSDYNVDIFAASLLIILSSIVMISFYIHSKRFSEIFRII